MYALRVAGCVMPSRFVEVSSPVADGVSLFRSWGSATIDSVSNISFSMSDGIQALTDAIPEIEMPQSLNETISVAFGTIPSPREDTKYLALLTLSAALLHLLYVSATTRHILSTFGSTRKRKSQ